MNEAEKKTNTHTHTQTHRTDWLGEKSRSKFIAFSVGKPRTHLQWWYCMNVYEVRGNGAKKNVWRNRTSTCYGLSVNEHGTRRVEDTTSNEIQTRGREEKKICRIQTIQRNGFIYWSNHRKFSLVCHTSQKRGITYANIYTENDDGKRWYYMHTQRQMAGECANKRPPQQQQQHCKKHTKRRWEGEWAWTNLLGTHTHTHTKDYLLFHLFGVVSGGGDSIRLMLYCQFDDLWPVSAKCRNRNYFSFYLNVFAHSMVRIRRNVCRTNAHTRAPVHEQNVCDR